MVKVLMAKVTMVNFNMVRGNMATKRHRIDLSLVILTKELAQIIVNVLYTVYPGYHFLLTQRATDLSVLGALQGTFTVWAESATGRWSSRGIDAVTAAATAAHTTALRLLTGASREIAALGPFANRVQTAVAFQSVAVALGATTATAINPSTFSDQWEVSVTAATKAQALNIIHWAARAVGCIERFDEGTVYISSSGSRDITVSGITLTREDAVGARPGTEAVPA